MRELHYSRVDFWPWFWVYYSTLTQNKGLLALDHDSQMWKVDSYVILTLELSDGFTLWCTFVPLDIVKIFWIKFILIESEGESTHRHWYRPDFSRCRFKSPVVSCTADSNHLNQFRPWDTNSHSKFASKFKFNLNLDWSFKYEIQVPRFLAPLSTLVFLFQQNLILFSY